MNKPDNSVLVIFGASGDLTKRKLIPALFNLHRQNFLPDNFAVLGVSRSQFSDVAFQKHVAESVNLYCAQKPVISDDVDNFSRHFYYQPIDTSNSADYALVKDKLSTIDKKHNTNENYIFYLSTPPSLYAPIARNLGTQGLNKQNNGKSWKRIIIEKPFGYDLETSRALNASLQKDFHEDQIYRIDHYLGKETVQNLLVFRFANGIFEPLWNRRYIHHVEITSAEHIGVENRGRYYDGAGAMRDMVQNHLLQVTGMVGMEPPALFDATSVRNETVKVFQALRPMNPIDIKENIVRGQYTQSTIRGEKIRGYREEKDVAPDSRTETFVAMKFYIDNWRWGGVPFFIRVGKRLPTRVTEVVIHFKRTPHYLFRQDNPKNIHDNVLVIRIQPDEGILLKFGMKLPGAGFHIKTVDMDFHYSDLAKSYVPTAYERLLLDCMNGDATLYARADAVEACWAFITPIIQAWQNNPAWKVYGYPAGTWGPKESSMLFNGLNEDWRYPCKNLSGDGLYCEL